MPKKINVKDIIKKNPLIDPKVFKASQRALDSRRCDRLKHTQYNIASPFDVKNNLRILDDIDKEVRCAHIQY